MAVSEKSYATVVLTGTTDGSGDATVTSSQKTPLYGDVLAVAVDGIALTDSANLVLTEEIAGAAGTTVSIQTIINNADIGNATVNNYYPSVQLQDNAGTGRVTGTDAIPTLYTMHGGWLKAVVSGGGATKAFKIWVTLRT